MKQTETLKDLRQLVNPILDHKEKYFRINNALFRAILVAEWISVDLTTHSEFLIYFSALACPREEPSITFSWGRGGYFNRYTQNQRIVGIEADLWR